MLIIELTLYTGGHIKNSTLINYLEIIYLLKFICKFLCFSSELNADAREKNDELYCLRCHDKMGIPICGACRYDYQKDIFSFVLIGILPIF